MVIVSIPEHGERLATVQEPLVSSTHDCAMCGVMDKGHEVIERLPDGQVREVIWAQKGNGIGIRAVIEMTPDKPRVGFSECVNWVNFSIECIHPSVCRGELHDGDIKLAEHHTGENGLLREWKRSNICT